MDTAQKHILAVETLIKNTFLPLLLWRENFRVSRKMSKSTIATCLADIGVDSALLKTMNRIEDEFALIKKTYFKKVLLVHPDKGN